MKVLLILILSMSVACSKNNDDVKPNLNDDFTQKVIYGDDDRLDLFEVQDQALLNLADSTLGLVNTSALTNIGEFTDVRTSDLNFCTSEPFSDQLGGPWCSGFLVGPDLVVTAGHCIRESRCSSVSFIFGYAKFSESHNPAQVLSSDVYNCEEVVGREQRFNGGDWAVVRLDRPVVGHDPLRLRRTGTPAVQTDLTVIGHPVGLPTKVAGNAQIRSVEEEYFVANLDTYGGNSGSAVFNTVTGEVEGILVRGENDFINRGGCRVSNICEDDACRGEDVTLISEVLDLVPEIDFPEPPTPPTDPGDGDGGDNNGDEFVNNEIIEIPDDSSSQAVSVIESLPDISDPGLLKIGLSITHTYIGDLRVTLIAPNGARVLLHNRTGWSSDNIVGIYGEDLNTYESLQILGPQPAGNWELEVKDLAPFDTGTIDSWAIILD